MRIRPAQACDHEALASFLARWNALRVARRGALEHALDHAALVAERDGRLVGVLTYVVTGAECEVLALHVDERRQGVSTALIAEAIEIAGIPLHDELELEREILGGESPVAQPSAPAQVTR
jgi:N-acetylglutamate synthase-like GNAT family acetyltransferase